MAHRNPRQKIHQETQGFLEGNLYRKYCRQTERTRGKTDIYTHKTNHSVKTRASGCLYTGGKNQGGPTITKRQETQTESESRPNTKIKQETEKQKPRRF